MASAGVARRKPARIVSVRGVEEARLLSDGDSFILDGPLGAKDKGKPPKQRVAEVRRVLQRGDAEAPLVEGGWTVEQTKMQVKRYGIADRR